MKRSGLALAAACTAVLITGCTFARDVELYRADGVMGVVGPYLFPEDTNYAPGYTLEGWDQVTVGMSRQQVEAILGPPQLAYRIEYDAPHQPDAGARWSYSPAGTNFRCRVLLFRNDIVVQKHSEYYLD